MSASGAGCGDGVSRTELALVRKAFEAKFDVGIDLKDEDELGVPDRSHNEAVAPKRVDGLRLPAGEREEGLDLVTSVDKANVLTDMYGLWREAVEKASAKYGIAEGVPVRRRGRAAHGPEPGAVQGSW